MPYQFKNVLNLQLPGKTGKSKIPREILNELMHPDFGPGGIDFRAITPMPPWAERNASQREPWMREHWYTGNNACGLEESVSTYDGGSTIEFTTQGSDVRELMRKLSMMFPHHPTLAVDYLWASADVGNDAGMVQYRGGELVYEYIPEPGGSAAFELAFDIYATEAADHGLVFDQALGTYRYIGQQDDNEDAEHDPAQQ